MIEIIHELFYNIAHFYTFSLYTESKQINQCIREIIIIIAGWETTLKRVRNRSNEGWSSKRDFLIYTILQTFGYFSRFKLIFILFSINPQPLYFNVLLNFGLRIFGSLKSWWLLRHLLNNVCCWLNSRIFFCREFHKVRNVSTCWCNHETLRCWIAHNLF